MSTRSTRRFSPDRVASAPAFIPLESIQVAAPCHADWDAMHGDDHSRFCGSCQKNVYNLSALTRAEAEALILQKEGNLCVRYFQREDGTMLTQDCPIGLLRVDSCLKGRLAVAAFVSSLALFCGALLAGAVAVPGAMATTVFPSVSPMASPTPADTAMVMGDIALPVTPTPLATKAPALIATMGEAVATAAKPTVTPAPTPTVAPVMGNPMIPPTGQMVLGRIASPPRKTPAAKTPTPTRKRTPRKHSS